MFARLMAKLGLDQTQYQIGLKKAQSSSQKFSRDVGRSIRNNIGGAFIAVFGARALANQGKQALDAAGKVRTLADSYGLTAEQVQKLQYAAAQSNISADTLFKAQKNLARVLVDTKDGSNEYRENLERLGVSMDDIESSDHYKLFEQISESLVGATINTEKLADMQAVFGRSGVDAIAAMSQGLNTIAKQAEQLGIIISESEILELAAAGDELTAYGFRWDSFFSRFMVKALRAGEVLLGMTKGALSGQGGAVGGALARAQILARTAIRNDARAGRTTGTDIIDPVTGEIETTSAAAAVGGMTRGGLSGLSKIGIFGAQKDIGLTKILDKVERNTSRTANATEEVARSGW